MSESKGKKEFVEPELIKCDEPLDKVTMTNGGPHCYLPPR